MSTEYLKYAVQSWLDACENAKSGRTERPSYFNTQLNRPGIYDSSRSPPARCFGSCRKHTHTFSICSEPSPDPTPSSLLNVGYRSRWELLTSLPTPEDTMKVLPILPTHYFTISELNNQLPDPALIRLPPSLFKYKYLAEAEYTRVLDLRECLHVEEIIVEMKTDMERLYLDPPVYHAYIERLGDVRTLMMRACQSLLYIEEECALHGLNLDISAIDERRMTNRPPNHPYRMIATYLKPSALEIFHNYNNFSDPIRLNAGDAFLPVKSRSQDAKQGARSEQQGRNEDNSEDVDMAKAEDGGDDDGEGDDENGQDVADRRVADKGTSDSSPISSRCSLVTPACSNLYDSSAKPDQHPDAHLHISNHVWSPGSWDHLDPTDTDERLFGGWPRIQAVAQGAGIMIF